jgi:predicted lysophospholipase L1 biosynthesis ABC-type transport system permease subunit
VLDEVLGIPAHPLLIHATVVFVPLLVLGAIVYPLWPDVRSRIGWAVIALAVIAPFTVLLAKVSGDTFKRRLIRRHLVSPQTLAKVTQHQAYGTTTLWWSIGLGVLALAMLWLVWNASRSGRPAPTGLWYVGTGLSIVVGVITGYYLFRTGDLGAHIAWQGY